MDSNKCRDGLCLCIYCFYYCIMPILFVYFAFFINL